MYTQTKASGAPRLPRSLRYQAKPMVTDDDTVLANALAILDKRIRTGPIFDSPKVVKEYARLFFAPATSEGREEFAAVFVSANHRVIEARTLFTGTLTSTSVYPREVVKAAIALNAAALVLLHNHPSGSEEISRADELLTHTLKSALALVDVRVLDHLVVGDHVVSFAERGLL